MTLHDKGGRVDNAKSEFCDKEGGGQGRGGVQTSPNLHDIIYVYPLTNTTVFVEQLLALPGSAYVRFHYLVPGVVCTIIIF